MSSVATTGSTVVSQQSAASQLGQQLNNLSSQPAMRALGPVGFQLFVFNVMLREENGNYYVRTNNEITALLRNEAASLWDEAIAPSATAAADNVRQNLGTYQSLFRGLASQLRGQQNPGQLLQQAINSNGIGTGAASLGGAFQQLANSASQVTTPETPSLSTASPASEPTATNYANYHPDLLAQPVYTEAQLLEMEENNARHQIKPLNDAIQAAEFDGVTISLAIDRFPGQGLSHEQARSQLAEQNRAFDAAVAAGEDVSGERLHLGLTIPIPWTDDAGNVTHYTTLPAVISGNPEDLLDFFQEGNDEWLNEVGVGFDADLGLTPNGVLNRVNQLAAQDEQAVVQALERSESSPVRLVNTGADPGVFDPNASNVLDLVPTDTIDNHEVLPGENLAELGGPQAVGGDPGGPPPDFNQQLYEQVAKLATKVGSTASRLASQTRAVGGRVASQAQTSAGNLISSLHLTHPSRIVFAMGQTVRLQWESLSEDQQQALKDKLPEAMNEVWQEYYTESYLRTMVNQGNTVTNLTLACVIMTIDNLSHTIAHGEGYTAEEFDERYELVLSNLGGADYEDPNPDQQSALDDILDNGIDIENFGNYLFEGLFDWTVNAPAQIAGGSIEILTAFANGQMSMDELHTALRVGAAVSNSASGTPAGAFADGVFTALSVTLDELADVMKANGDWNEYDYARYSEAFISSAVNFALHGPKNAALIRQAVDSGEKTLSEAVDDAVRDMFSPSLDFSGDYMSVLGPALKSRFKVLLNRLVEEQRAMEKEVQQGYQPTYPLMETQFEALEPTAEP